MPATSHPALPACPCCHFVPVPHISISNLIAYECANDTCELYPATSYHPTEDAARAEWLEISSAS